MSQFVFPGASDRTVVIGETGSGKTVGGAWLLSKQNFEKRPWIAMDYKDEELWDLVGDPPMRELKVGRMPGKKGLYRCHVNPGQEDDVEEWLWDIWRHGNIGLFCDEATLLPGGMRRGGAMKAILRQGRSKLLPVIACTQRPVEIDREFFTESQYKMIFRIGDKRDKDTIKLFSDGLNLDVPLEKHHSLWVDSKQKAVFRLGATPPPKEIALKLRQVVPYSFSLF